MLTYDEVIMDLLNRILNACLYNFSVLRSNKVNFSNSHNQRLIEIFNNSFREKGILRPEICGLLR